MNLDPLSLYVLLCLSLSSAGWLSVQVLRFRPDRPLFHRDVVELRWARCAAAALFLLALAISCLGLPSTPGAAWDTGWWLHWERSVSDWVLMAELSIVVLAALLAWCVLPETGWFRERRDLRRRKAEALADETFLREQQLLSIPEKERPAGLGKLVRTFPDTCQTGHWEALRRIHTGEEFAIPRTGVGRRRLLRELAHSRVDEDNRGDHYFWAPTWHGTARHEAGHAVIHAAFGNHVLHVYVIKAGHGVTVHARRARQLDSDFIPDHLRWLEGRWERMVALFGGILMDRQQGRSSFQEGGSLSDMEKAMRCAYDLYVRGALLDGTAPADGVAGWISAAYTEATEILAATTDVQEQIVTALHGKRLEGRSVLGVYELAPILAGVSNRPDRVSTTDRERRR